MIGNILAAREAGTSWFFASKTGWPQTLHAGRGGMVRSAGPSRLSVPFGPWRSPVGENSPRVSRLRCPERETHKPRPQRRRLPVGGGIGIALERSEAAMALGVVRLAGGDAALNAKGPS